MKKTTYQEPSCQDHDRMVLDLARGQLDDDQAAIAERIRHDCPACRSWWQDTLSGEPAAEVGSAVVEAFASFEAPRHRHPRHRHPRHSHPRHRHPRHRRPLRWLAAAAVFFALILGFSTFQHRDVHSVPGAESRAAGGKIFAHGFESGSATRGTPTLVVEQVAGEPHAAADTVPLGGSGGGDTVFVGSFESGDLVAWSPMTRTGT